MLPWKADAAWEHDGSEYIYLLEGNEFGRLSRESRDLFIHQSYTITTQSDRMGYQIKGESIFTDVNEEVVSSAVNFGTIQLLPGGQLTVLMADHQTTGGYPRLAHVITAHHSRLAQMKPGDIIRFQFVNMSTAEELLVKQHHHLLQLKNASAFRLQQYLDGQN